MTLLNNILKWTQTLPAWQRDAARRLLQREEGLSEDDYAELYALLKAEHGLPNPDSLTPEPLAASHLPATIQPGQSVILKEVGKLTHVNRIAPDQKLVFSEIGMSVIYGGNGSGKSGYVRVMKQACRCRDQSERVYPNANDAASAHKTPTAKFKIEKDGNIHKIEWEQDCVPDELLSSISVFDTRCARSYLTAEQDVAYLPYGLDIVENMARDVIPELEHRLSAEISAIDTNIYVFNHLAGETKVGDLISKLSARTNPKTVETLGTLSKEEEKRIAALGKALAEADPITKAGDIKRFVSRLKTLAENVKKVNLWVNVDAVKRFKKLDDEVVEAELAEKDAALALQAGEELLPGTGESLWKALFEAARKYSTEAAYPDHAFPHSSDGALCPLCQTPLDDAGERLKRFEKYIKDDVAKTANKKRENLATIRKKIENANLEIALDQELSDEIDQFDGDIVQVIKEYQASINEKRQWMLGALRHDWDNPPSLAGSAYLDLRRLAAQNLREARTFVKAANEEHKKKLEQEHSELIARQNLQKSLHAVLDLIERLKKVTALKKCKDDLKTKPISDKSKEFGSEAVTKELKAALDNEFANLEVGHIKTKLKERNDKGKIFHQLLLEIPTNRNIDEILSEGEQRAIALGAFLAELSLADHSCGIVFDDPVSSLDHWRRQHVARRLAQEAKKRQVIVFTHDTSFLGQLRDEIDENNLDNKICFLEWKGQYAGNVCDGLPWGHSSYKERIDALEKMHKDLVKKPWPQYPSEDDAADMLKAYDRMRAAIERVIQDVVFNGVVRRYRDWINIGSLKGVVGFDDAECDEINRLYQRCNDLVDAHDPSSAKNAPVPNVTELGKDIDDLKAVIKTIQDRRKVS
jgi:ABC-type dipeptide/oligopeptide/nickel transport system ATPase subunit